MMLLSLLIASSAIRAKTVAVLLDFGPRSYIGCSHGKYPSANKRLLFRRDKGLLQLHSGDWLSIPAGTTATVKFRDSRGTCKVFPGRERWISEPTSNSQRSVNARIRREYGNAVERGAGFVYQPFANETILSDGIALKVRPQPSKQTLRLLGPDQDIIAVWTVQAGKRSPDSVVWARTLASIQGGDAEYLRLVNSSGEIHMQVKLIGRNSERRLRVALKSLKGSPPEVDRNCALLYTKFGCLSRALGSLSRMCLSSASDPEARRLAMDLAKLSGELDLLEELRRDGPETDK